MTGAVAVGVAALVGGLAGAGIALAVRDSDGASSSSTPQATPIVSAAPKRHGALSAEAVYRRGAPGVVVITATQSENVPATAFSPAVKRQVRVLGSGFVLDRRGDIVTNEHVVANGKDVTVGFSAGATYSAKVLGTDPSTDVAVIRVNAPRSALDPLSLADSNSVQVGDTVYAIGNPFGLDRTMTAGIVSAVGRDIQAPNGLSIPRAIQTDAPINHGNSGGPLLDVEGQVIGINDQLQSGGAVDGNVGVGFAIASNTVRAIVPQLLTTGKARHAWLGVEVAPVDPRLAEIERSLPRQGVFVVRVLKGSPAAKAGLKAGTKQITVDGESALVGGDVIMSAGGKTVRSPAQLTDAVSERKPGSVIDLAVSRNGRKRTVQVKLGEAPGA
jgi:S1-C subfamily serine protease